MEYDTFVSSFFCHVAAARTTGKIILNLIWSMSIIVYTKTDVNGICWFLRSTITNGLTKDNKWTVQLYKYHLSNIIVFVALLISTLLFFIFVEGLLIYFQCLIKGNRYLKYFRRFPFFFLFFVQFIYITTHFGYRKRNKNKSKQFIWMTKKKRESDQEITLFFSTTSLRFWFLHLKI